jgi:hypothetical protein
MPEIWDAPVYRQRAAVWRKRAAEPPTNAEQTAACLSIAENYDHLANLSDDTEKRSTTDR